MYWCYKSNLKTYCVLPALYLSNMSSWLPNPLPNYCLLPLAYRPVQMCQRIAKYIVLDIPIHPTHVLLRSAFPNTKEAQQIKTDNTNTTKKDIPITLFFTYNPPFNCRFDPRRLFCMFFHQCQYYFYNHIGKQNQK